MIAARKRAALHGTDAQTEALHDASDHALERDKAIAALVPTNALAVAALQREAEAEAPTVRALVCRDADDYALADALLTDVVQRHDAATTMRGTATKPLYGVIRTVEGWFRPYLGTLESMRDSLKSAMGAYLVEQERTARTARELAAVAAETGDADTLIAALTIATESAEKPAGAARASFRWMVKRVAHELLMPEFIREAITVEVAQAALRGTLAGYKGDDPPVVPGVIFERVANIGASHVG